MAATTKVLGDLKLTENVLTDFAIDEKSVTTAMIEDAFVNRVSTLEQTIGGVSGAMHFKGVATVMPQGATLPEGTPDAGKQAEAGDVVIFGQKEFVYIKESNSWEELGDTSATDKRVTDLETSMTAAQGDITALKARVEIVQQSSIANLDADATLNQIRATINELCIKLQNAHVFKLGEPTR